MTNEVILLTGIKNRYLTEEIYNSLPSVIKERFDSCFDYISESIQSLRQLIDNIITETSEILESVYDNKDSENFINYLGENSQQQDRDCDRIIRDLITYNNKTIQKQKKRWFQYVKNELAGKSGKAYKYIMKEVEYTKLLKDMGTDNLRIEDTNELIKRRLKQIEDWTLDKNSLMIEFPYLKNLTPKQILNAFTYDLKNIIYHKLLTNYAGDPNTYIIPHPNILLEMGALFGVSTRVPIAVSQRINRDTKENEFYYEYDSGDKTIVSIVAKNKDGRAINPVFMHNLDQDDMILFLSTLAFRKADFFKNKIIRVYFRDMAQYLNKPINGTSYNFIKERYEKLFNREFEVKYTEGDRNIVHKIRFFQYMKFDVNNKYSDRSYVDVQVSDFIAQQLIDMQTTNMYRNQLMSFTNPVSKLIMFPLQRHRLDCYIYNRDYRKIDLFL